MEGKRPHKSTWKVRKKLPEVAGTKEKTYMDDELRESLNKVKNYAKIVAILLIIPALSFILGMVIPYVAFLATFGPFFELIGVFIVIFMIYFPISDALKKPEPSKK
ncbi:MAG: hypothetical protein ACTSRS_19140 [Candidatus Helarchaeota archaeon]